MWMPTRATGETSWKKEIYSKAWRISKTVKQRGEGWGEVREWWVVGCKVSEGRKIGCPNMAENLVWLDDRLWIKKSVQCMIRLKRWAEGSNTPAQAVIQFQVADTVSNVSSEEEKANAGIWSLSHFYSGDSMLAVPFPGSVSLSDLWKYRPWTCV